MSETWYRIGRHSSEIKPVQVVSSTKQKLLLAKVGYSRERHVSKQSTWDSYHPSWVEAHAALLVIAETVLRNARFELQTAQSFHGNVIGMKEPVQPVSAGERNGPDE